MEAREIIKKFPRPRYRNIGNELGLEWTAIRSMYQRNNINAKHWPALLRYARRLKIKLKIADFINEEGE